MSRSDDMFVFIACTGLMAIVLLYLLIDYIRNQAPREGDDEFVPDWIGQRHNPDFDPDNPMHQKTTGTLRRESISLNMPLFVIGLIACCIISAFLWFMATY